MTEKKSKHIVLFKDENMCCACGACENICPTQAIQMREDKYGFSYPEINHEICIECGQCKSVCNYQKQHIKRNVKEAYVAASNNISQLLESASGGIFSALAEGILEQGGVIYGAAMEKEDSTLNLKHIRVENKENLPKLQGSKYAQSNIGKIFKSVERDLKEKYVVLFSGTPCQIAGLMGYLKKDYENLYTVDIVCHGVPNIKLFQAYISNLMKRWSGEIIDFKFRDKKNGWGLSAKVTFRDMKGVEKVKRIPSGASSYFDMFLKAEIYRKNCYTCPYACQERVGDITLGDYWGIQKEHPELMIEAGGKYSDNNGVSCVLVNSVKGERILNMISDKVSKNLSTLKKVSNENAQLKHPSQRVNTREYILKLYEEQGWLAVERYFRERNGIRTLYCYLKQFLPRSLKKRIKKILKKV